MVGDMYFYIEFNAYPISTVNSSDLEVYIIGKDVDISTFNSSWFENGNAELVGTLTKGSTYHHVHTSTSSHRLVPLATNSDGTIGNKRIDVSGDFWVVLYSKSPNNNRGWSFQYHPSSLCNNTNRWYIGDISGWTTTYQSGCPDSHVHIARRDANYIDGIETYVTANYGSESYVSDPVSFYFGELPNLPPVASSFVTPTVGGTYSGNLDVTWDESSDPNMDPITYNIYLKQGSTTISTLASNTSGLSVQIDTSQFDDGQYTLTGEVCDGVNACVPFSLNGDFSISNTLPIQSISSISLTTTNSNEWYAKAGNTVSLVFNATGVISTPTVDMYFDGDEILGDGTLSSDGNRWTYSYVIQSGDSNGRVIFDITSSTLDLQYQETTDGSNIIIDTMSPSTPTSSLGSGTYPSTSTYTTSLSSEGSNKIVYITTDDELNCSNGDIYSNPITISSDTSLKILGCDYAGNISEISSYEYLIREDLTYISIYSDNGNNTWARNGNKVTIEYTSSGLINNPSLILYLDNDIVSSDIDTEYIGDNKWVSEYLISDSELNGVLSFEISSDDLYKMFNDTTDSSSVYIDNIPPQEVLASPVAGRYGSAKLISLSSIGSGYIRYTLDGSEPTCSTGTLYLYPIGILSSKNIYSIACDEAGNMSSLGLFNYIINISNLSNEDDIDEVFELSSIGSDIDRVDHYDSVEDLQHSLNIGEYIVQINNIDGVYFISELRVKIVDSNGEPLPNITVYLHSNPKEIVTDINGLAIFKNIEYGSHSILVEYGNQKIERSLNIDMYDLDTDTLVLDTVVISVENNFVWYEYVLYILISILLLLFFWIFFKKYYCDMQKGR